MWVSIPFAAARFDNPNYDISFVDGTLTIFPVIIGLTEPNRRPMMVDVQDATSICLAPNAVDDALDVRSDCDPVHSDSEGQGERCRQLHGLRDSNPPTTASTSMGPYTCGNRSAPPCREVKMPRRNLRGIAGLGRTGRYGHDVSCLLFGYRLGGLTNFGPGHRSDFQNTQRIECRIVQDRTGCSHRAEGREILDGRRTGTGRFANHEAHHHAVAFVGTTKDVVHTRHGKRYSQKPPIGIIGEENGSAPSGTRCTLPCNSW